MTKKHFQRAADLVAVIQQTQGSQEAMKVAQVLIELFSGDNPRFDRGRFLKACGL